MNAMLSAGRKFAWTLLILWTVLCIAAAIYSQIKNIPTWLVLAVVPAFLLESGFYLAAGLRSSREFLERWQPARLACAMTVTAAVPYVVYSLGTGVFSLLSMFEILALAGVASFWFVVFGRRSSTDLAYLALMAAPVLLKVFPAVYADPYDLQVAVLGALMWYRTGVLAVLSIRQMEGINFGFLPARADWAVGVRNFVYFLPLGFALGYWLDFFSLRTSLNSMWPLVFIVTFVAILWVLATAEEFFFRGLLQQMLTRVSGNKWVGLLAASMIFGLAHLGFGKFPNWKFVLLATCAGLFYGRAYMQAQSIRAAMVTHALVVTVWKVFLVA
jgi:membrane protease YdiL (CAAX protease family)